MNPLTDEGVPVWLWISHPKNFFHKPHLKNILQDFTLANSARKAGEDRFSKSDGRLLRHFIFLIFSQKGKKISNLPRICHCKCNNISV